jgi:hydrogenase assembly chaperone HypC/HupF
VTTGSPGAASRCDDQQGCLTCGDAAIPMRILELDPMHKLGLCEAAGGRRQTVELALVEPVAIGDGLLVHAGTAIATISEERVTTSPAAPGRGSGVGMPEAQAEGKAFRAGAEEAGMDSGAEQPAGMDSGAQEAAGG